MKVQGNDASASVKQLIAAAQNSQPKAAAKGSDSDGDNDRAREASEQRESDTKGGNINATA